MHPAVSRGAGLSASHTALVLLEACFTLVVWMIFPTALQSAAPGWRSWPAQTQAIRLRGDRERGIPRFIGRRAFASCGQTCDRRLVIQVSDLLRSGVRRISGGSDRSVNVGCQSAGTQRAGFMGEWRRRRAAALIRVQQQRTSTAAGNGAIPGKRRRCDGQSIWPR